MAQIIKYYSGSYHVGNPILYSVQADAPNGICVFHRVVLEVTASLRTSSSGELRSTVVPMSQPVESGEEALIDISSALRSVLDGYQYEPEPLLNPLYIPYTLRAWDEYMIDGETYDEHNTHIATHDGGTVYPGTLSDRERMVSNPSDIRYRGTCKPSATPEIALAGMVYLRPEGTQPPFTIRQYTLSGTIPSTITNPSVYCLAADTPDVYEFRFVNRYGCLESAIVHSLPSSETKYDVHEYVIARQQSFLYSSRGVSRKRNDRETWKFTTQPLDRAWQQWWLHEALMAETAWIKIDGLWIQCHIIPEDTVAGVDRAKGDALTVTFSVRLDITGNPFNS